MTIVDSKPNLRNGNGIVRSTLVIVGSSFTFSVAESAVLSIVAGRLLTTPLDEISHANCCLKSNNPGSFH